MTMSKIDKLSIDYAQKVIRHDVDADLYRDADWYRSVFRENVVNFKDAADYLFAPPLSDRLTDAEKDMIRKEYADTYPNDVDNDITSISKAHMLERIFGKEFFKED